MFQILFVSILSLAAGAAAERTASITDIEPVGLQGVHGMEILPDGRLVLADTYKSARTPKSFLYVRDGQGWTRTNLEGQGFAGVSYGNLTFLICDVVGSRVLETDEHFRILRAWKVPSPWIARRLPDGQPHVLTAGGSFVRLLPNGGSQVLLAGLDSPFDFVPGARSNEVWISEQGARGDGRVSLWRVLPSPAAPEILRGERVLEARERFANPEGLAFVGGTLWVADTGLGRLVKVATDGKAVVARENLGLPILVRPHHDELVIYSMNFQGGPALVRVRP